MSLPPLAVAPTVASELPMIDSPTPADFRQLADAMPQIVWTAHADGWIDWYNERWYTYTGQTPVEASGWGWQAVHHPADLPHVMERWPQSIASGEAFDMEFRLRGVDGEFRWFLTRVLPIRDVSGSVTKWVGTNTDISEQKLREDRLRLLSDAGQILTRTLDLPKTLDALTSLLVPSRADFAAVYLVEERGTIRRTAQRLADCTSSEVERALEVFETTTLPIAVRTGQPQWEARPCSCARSDARCRSCRVSYIAVPLSAGSTSSGVLVVYSTSAERRYTQSDVIVLSELAQRVSLAVANARNVEQQFHVAAVLQQAALPQRLPIIDRLSLDAVYRPGSNEATIGGDWYDAFELPDGRVVLTIGDVFGSGLHAAVSMTKLRQAMQSAALICPDPAIMLQAADYTLRMHDPDGYASAIALILDLHRGVITFASAGHFGPLLRSPDGQVWEYTSAGTLLGLRTPDAGMSTAIAAAPGSVLVLYTDGLVEAGRDLLDGQRRVRRAVAAMDPAALARPALAIANAVLGTTSSLDDVAILTATILPSPSASDSDKLERLDGSNLARDRQLVFGTGSITCKLN